MSGKGGFDMHDNIGLWITDTLTRFVKDSPENSLKLEQEEKAFDDILIGFSSGADPIYIDYKEHVGPFHWTPLDILSLTFPETELNANQITVISWILPQREATKADNRKETTYPSKRWVHARFPGEEFNNRLRSHLVDQLNAVGVKSVAPLLSPLWKRQTSARYGFASLWSERHAAYAAGLGTFGLCDGLITLKGKAHRVGSVVANVAIPPTPRRYDDHHAYCLFFHDGSCNGCRKRCPVGAITEKGHDKEKCWAHAGVTCAQYARTHYGFDGYGCGLCQTGVPCESAIPAKIAKARPWLFE